MTQLQNIDPYDANKSVQATTLEALEADPHYSLAMEVAADCQQLHTLVSQQPRFAALFDQLQRNSSSVGLNIAQGYGKLRGFLANDLLCARAEAFEGRQDQGHRGEITQRFGP